MAHVAWAKGGEAEVTALAEDMITLRSSRSSAPGSRLDGALASGAAVRVKVHRCRRLPDSPDFEIAGRLLDATREVRAELGKLVAPA